MKNLIIIALIFGIAKLAIALDSDYLEKPNIDKDLEIIENELDQIRAECVKKTKKMSEQMKCGEDAWEKYNAEGKIRGTDEYCHYHYRSYDLKGLRKLKESIKSEWKLAREPLPTERKNGELTKSDFWCEMLWIDLRITDFLQNRKLK